MFQKILGLAFVVVVMIWPIKAYAEEQFLTNYDVNYDVGTDGSTTVIENITFKNNTDKFYASKYTVSIGATKISDVSAYDKKGPLQTNVTVENNRTKIEVSFVDQIVGLDKEYGWTLRYKSNDYAERTGKVWLVTVPRAPKLVNGDEYNLSLSVPVSFGDPTAIDPKPTRKVESGGKIRMFFDRSQLAQTGILASFGSVQVMDFDIKYVMENKSVLPIYGKLPLPMDTEYQQVLINDLNPKPENVSIDEDGNYIAWYKLDREQVLNIEAKGMVRLSLKSSSEANKELSKFEINRLTKTDKYWDVDNPSIKQKLNEILSGSPNIDTRAKARLIDKFVVNFLTYNQGRVAEQNFERLGSVAALNNPTEALCGEYADLFVALARAAGIPARRLEGYAYTSNREIRPLSLGTTLLHAWAEYYDPIKGWVMVDPTWESSNDGVDYFSNFDLNHFVLAIQGGNSTQPSASGDVSVKVSDANFGLVKKNDVEIFSNDVVLAGLPVNFRVRVSNVGNTVLAADDLIVGVGNLGSLENGKYRTGKIPPFGYFETEAKLVPNNFWSKVNGSIEASFSGVFAQKAVELRPFYEYRLIFGLAVGSTVLMIGVYSLSLYLHIKSQKSSKPSKKKDVAKVYSEKPNT